MKFVFNLVLFYCFSFLFRKGIPGFKRRIIIINILNPGILFLNRKARSPIGFNIYLPASPGVLSLIPLDALHLKKVDVLSFKIHMLMSQSFSMSQLSLKYVCFLLFFFRDILLVLNYYYFL